VTLTSCNYFLTYALVKANKQLRALRTFSLQDMDTTKSRSNSIPSGQHEKTVDLTSEHSTSQRADEGQKFSIGDEDSEDESLVEGSQTEEIPNESSSTNSAAEALKMSEKARGKLPQRTSSATSLTPSNTAFDPDESWINTWLPLLPLHTLLVILDMLIPQIGELPESRENQGRGTLRLIRSTRLPDLEVGHYEIRNVDWSQSSLTCKNYCTLYLHSRAYQLAMGVHLH